MIRGSSCACRFLEEEIVNHDSQCAACLWTVGQYSSLILYATRFMEQELSSEYMFLYIPTVVFSQQKRLYHNSQGIEIAMSLENIYMLIKSTTTAITKNEPEILIYSLSGTHPCHIVFNHLGLEITTLIR